jgi:hypothetical protein
MNRLLCAGYVLVVGVKEAIPAWFQHAAVREKSNRDTPKRYLRFGSNGLVGIFLSTVCDK